MLRSLDISDVLIIDHLSLDFETGLNVLTGETGAGKSILLDALGAVLGWRGRADLVRSGAEQGEIIAVFDLTPDHPAHRILDEAGLPGSDELILRRVIQGGRRSAFVNDRRASAAVMRALSDTLVELHGQQDDRGLLDAKGHRALLDAFADASEQRRQVRTAWAASASARATLVSAENALEAARAEEDFLRHAVRELSELAPQPGEDAELDIARRRMQSAVKIRDDVVKAGQLLGNEGGEGSLMDALRWLEGVSDKAGGQLDDPLAALGRALIELGEASSGVETALEAMSVDANELERTEERLFAIRALARKHDVAPDELAGFAAELQMRLSALDGAEDNLSALRAALGEAEQTYSDAAAILSQIRRDAGARLDQAMAKELAPLKLERARFETRIELAEPGPEGVDQVAFCVATQADAPTNPIGQIASGGELSRFLLALKVCLAAGDQQVTMIFDEIDRGVGGATADAVGRRLAALAQGGQVLVVTHSPQVAALGQYHWRVEKHEERGTTLSRVVPVQEDERIDEIARMLAGDTVTQAARDAAIALLQAR